MNAMINRANSARRSTIKLLEASVRSFVFNKPSSNKFELPTQIEAELVTVAVRPSSLGFSAHDLNYFCSFYSKLLEQKKSDWQYHLRKSQRAGDKCPKGLILNRDKAYKHVKAMHIIVDTIQGEINRRENVSLKAQRDEYERQQEAKAQREAIERAQREEEAKQLAEREAAKVQFKAITKRKSRSTFKAPKAEFKTTLKGFDTLAEAIESRSRDSWVRKPLLKADAVKMVGSSEDLELALRIAQKYATDEVVELDDGVITWRKQGNSVRYGYYGAVA
jgi:hypothetical protein